MKIFSWFYIAIWCTVIISGFLTNVARSNEATEAKSPLEIDFRVLRKHGWLAVHGKISAVDPDKRTITVEGTSRPYVFNVTEETKIWNFGKPGTIKEAKTGEDVDAVVKINPDQSILAVQISLGKPSQWLPSGIKQSTKDWVKSPYAPDKPAINVREFAHGSIVKCPYTGKPFIRP